MGRRGDVGPQVKAHTEMPDTPLQSASERSTEGKIGCQITMFINKTLATVKAFGLICLQCLCVLPFAVFSSCTCGEICLVPCMSAGRKGHLEGPSISHGAPHTTPGGPGVAKEKDLKRHVAWVSLRTASAAQSQTFKRDSLCKEGLMGRDVPEGWLAEEEGYRHWARRQPRMETSIQATHRAAGCTAAKFSCSRVTICYIEENPISSG